MSFFGGLWNSFTGDAQKDDLAAGKTAGDAARQKGLTDATGYAQDYYGKATGFLSPYTQGDNGLFADSTGANGEAARSAAQKRYFSDDVLSQMRTLDLKRTNNAANAGGSVNSGAAALAGARTMLQNYTGWQNQLAGLRQSGQEAAGRLGVIASQTGGQLGSYAMGYGQQQGQAEGDYASAKANSEGILGANLMGLASLGVKAFTPTATGYTPFQGMYAAATGNPITPVSNPLYGPYGGGWGAGAAAYPYQAQPSRIY